MTLADADEDRRDLSLLAELARQSKRRMFILGVVIVLAGALASASAIVVATTRGERVLCYVVSVLLVALGAFLAGIARRSAQHLLGLMPRIARGEGVVWLYIDAREIGGGSQLLHIIADDGAEHAMVLSAGDISSAVAVLRERVPNARYGEDAKLRERYERDRVGVARELTGSGTSAGLSIRRGPRSRSRQRDSSDGSVPVTAGPNRAGARPGRSGTAPACRLTRTVGRRARPASTSTCR